MDRHFWEHIDRHEEGRGRCSKTILHLRDRVVFPLAANAAGGGGGRRHVPSTPDRSLLGLIRPKWIRFCTLRPRFLHV